MGRREGESGRKDVGGERVQVRVDGEREWEKEWDWVVMNV